MHYRRMDVRTDGWPDWVSQYPHFFVEKRGDNDTFAAKM